uniref:EGF-like domain-containing protein n=1 Tax=Trichuris muris TaxID=70415 RepID=A0A5S6PZR1_TRIMR
MGVRAKFPTKQRCECADDPCVTRSFFGCKSKKLSSQRKWPEGIPTSKGGRRLASNRVAPNCDELPSRTRNPNDLQMANFADSRAASKQVEFAAINATESKTTPGAKCGPKCCYPILYLPLAQLQLLAVNIYVCIDSGWPSTTTESSLPFRNHLGNMTLQTGSRVGVALLVGVLRTSTLNVRRTCLLVARFVNGVTALLSSFPCCPVGDCDDISEVIFHAFYSTYYFSFNPPTLMVNYGLLILLGVVVFLSSAVDPMANSDDYYLRSFKITCCENGHPVPDDDIAQAVQELTIEEVEDDGRFSSCKSYTGYYNISVAEQPPREKFGEFGVKCKCPDGMTNLDRNCRYVPECLNGGYRSFSIDLRCVCPKPWFGPLCDKFCANGVLTKQHGYDLCQCRENFYGEECDHILCFNHGTPVKGRGCLCRFPYVGLHCETELSHLVEFPSDSRVKWYSYLFGTCFSIFLIMVVAMAAYCLFRRRKLSRARMVNVGTNATSNGHLGPYESDYSGHIFWTDDCGRVFDLARLPPPPTYQDATVVLARPQDSGVRPTVQNEEVSNVTTTGADSSPARQGVPGELEKNADPTMVK